MDGLTKAVSALCAQVPALKPAAVTDADMGTWVDGSHGIYLPLQVCRIAERFGWDGLRGTLGAYAEWQREGKPETFDYWFAHSYQFACEDMDVAENHMQTFAPDGFYFGANEHTGDWGLWADNGEEF